MFDLYDYDSQSKRRRWEKRMHIMIGILRAFLLLMAIGLVLWSAGLHLVDIWPDLQTGTVLQR